MRRFLLICLLGLAFPVSASAELRPDSAAPPGASVIWLPAEEWVMERWMPFDGDRLASVFRMTRGDIYYYLLDGHGNLEKLARRQGLPVERLAVRLLEPRRSAVSKRKWRVLLTRTRRMLDQRHLAEHVIGHAFHHWSIWRRPERIWGPRYYSLYARGLSFPAISRRVGTPRDVLRGRILRALARGRRRGLRQKALSVKEAGVMVAWQRIAINELIGGPGAGLIAASSGAAVSVRDAEGPLCSLRPRTPAL